MAAEEKCKKSQETKVIIIILIFLTLGLCYFSYRNKPTISNDDDFQNKIDSLEYVIGDLSQHKDSLVSYLDTIYVEKEKNIKKYEENIDAILLNNTDEDFYFFTEYINRNKTRLDSICNSRAN